MQPQEQKIFELLQSRKSQVDPNLFPDFLVLGPQCTGTTWLSKNLRKHPNIFMTTPKELFFFTEQNLCKFLRQEHEFDLADYMSYFKWSRLPFLKQKPLIKGEATASYAWQPLGVIQGIVSLNPNLKGIIMVRDPVDKVWSNLRRKMVGERGYADPKDVPDSEIDRFIHDPHQIGSAKFSTMIENWSQNLGEGNLFVGAFTDIAERPTELLVDLFNFLGVDADKDYVSKRAFKRIRVGKKRPLPERWQSQLEDIFQEERQRLRDDYGYDFTK